MKKHLLSTILLFVILSVFADGKHGKHVKYYVKVKPTHTVVVNVGPSPGPKHVWVDGYWVWLPADQRYEWKEGYWAVPPQKYHKWVPGHWKETPNGWYWVGGHWN